MATIACCILFEGKANSDELPRLCFGLSKRALGGESKMGASHNCAFKLSRPRLPPSLTTSS